MQSTEMLLFSKIIGYLLVKLLYVNETTSSSEPLDNEVGIGLENRFCHNASHWRWGKDWPKFDRRLQWNLLAAKHKVAINGRLYIDGEMKPESSFSPSTRLVNLFNYSNVSRIVPSKTFARKDYLSGAVRLPLKCGIFPRRLFWRKESIVSSNKKPYSIGTFTSKHVATSRELYKVGAAWQVGWNFALYVIVGQHQNSHT
jgi:hypothetical protein